MGIGLSLSEQAQQYNWTPEYTKTQEDMGAIRELMATQGAGYMVTGAGSMEDGGNSLAFIPQLMNKAGIAPTQGILDAYQKETGVAYSPGQNVTGYDASSGKYVMEQAPSQKPTPVAQTSSVAQAPAAQLAPQSVATAQTPSWKTEIQGQLASLSSLNDQNALDGWLANSKYSVEQLAEASGYKVADVAAAISKAKSKYGSQTVAPGSAGASTSGQAASGGLIPSYQSTQTNRFTPATPKPISLVQVNPSMTSQPAMNADAVSAISGLPINQSRFPNAGQPTGMLAQANPNYLSDIDLQKTLTPQDYISRFGVKA